MNAMGGGGRADHLVFGSSRSGINNVCLVGLARRVFLRVLKRLLPRHPIEEVDGWAVDESVQRGASCLLRGCSQEHRSKELACGIRASVDGGE